MHCPRPVLQLLIKLKRFKYHTIAVVLALLAVHIGMFILIWMLIAAQRSLLGDLYNISEWRWGGDMQECVMWNLGGRVGGVPGNV